MDPTSTNGWKFTFESPFSVIPNTTGSASAAAASIDGIETLAGAALMHDESQPPKTLSKKTVTQINLLDSDHLKKLKSEFDKEAAIYDQLKTKLNHATETAHSKHEKYVKYLRAVDFKKKLKAEYDSSPGIQGIRAARNLDIELESRDWIEGVEFSFSTSQNDSWKYAFLKAFVVELQHMELFKIKGEDEGICVKIALGANGFRAWIPLEDESETMELIDPLENLFKGPFRAPKFNKITYDIDTGEIKREKPLPKQDGSAKAPSGAPAPAASQVTFSAAGLLESSSSAAASVLLTAASLPPSSNSTAAAKWCASSHQTALTARKTNHYNGASQTILRAAASSIPLKSGLSPSTINTANFCGLELVVPSFISVSSTPGFLYYHFESKVFLDLSPENKVIFVEAFQTNLNIIKSSQDKLRADLVEQEKIINKLNKQIEQQSATLAELREYLTIYPSTVQNCLAIEKLMEHITVEQMLEGVEISFRPKNDEEVNLSWCATYIKNKMMLHIFNKKTKQYEILKLTVKEVNGTIRCRIDTAGLQTYDALLIDPISRKPFQDLIVPAEKNHRFQYCFARKTVRSLKKHEPSTTFAGAAYEKTYLLFDTYREDPSKEITAKRSTPKPVHSSAGTAAAGTSSQTPSFPTRISLPTYGIAKNLTLTISLTDWLKGIKIALDPHINLDSFTQELKTIPVGMISDENGNKPLYVSVEANENLLHCRIEFPYLDKIVDDLMNDQIFFSNNQDKQEKIAFDLFMTSAYIHQQYEFRDYRTMAASVPIASSSSAAAAAAAPASTTMLKDIKPPIATKNPLLPDPQGFSDSGVKKRTHDKLEAMDEDINAADPNDDDHGDEADVVITMRQKNKKLKTDTIAKPQPPAAPKKSKQPKAAAAAAAEQ